MTDLCSIARRLCADEPGLVSSLDFGPFVAQGCGDGPAVIIGDASEISLFNSTTGGALEYRMSLLAGPGDFVLVRQRDQAFEGYLAEYLGITDVTYIEIGKGSEASIAHLARKSHFVVDQLASLASQHGSLTLKPYITTGHVWRLAQLIGEVAQTPVYVCGPSPRVARRANDKLWFLDLVHEVVGRDGTPPTYSSFGPSATAALVAHVARTAERVVVKVPDSAGSAGNVSVDAAAVQGRSLWDVRGFLLRCLHASGWRDTYPVLVGVWDADVVCSPSVQLWIPDLAEGPPLCEGVFEQSVVGREGKFVGAMRASLSDDILADLTDQAIRLASVLQRIGYFGRCSFDAVLQRRGSGPDAIHWIECNGRWGGVSIPLSAMLARGFAKPGGMMIAQVTVPEVHLTTTEVIDRLAGLLAQPGGQGLVLTAPARTPNGTLLSAFAVAGSDGEAEALIAKALARLRGVDAS